MRRFPRPIPSADERGDETAVSSLIFFADGEPVLGIASGGHRVHTQMLAAILDVALSRYDEVWAAGGHPHYAFPTNYDELVRITGGEAAEVGA